MIRKRNEQLAKTVIKGLQSRNMSGYYAEDKEAALKQALELIPEGSTIAMGGCMSAGEIGLISALEAGNYHYIDRSKMDARAGLMAAYDADIFLSSANAITSDGVMVNIDGNSNRVSCIAQGPRKVIFIVGINKVCADLDSAMKRARNGSSHQCPEIRHQDSLQGDRKMLRLQISGYHLLSVPDHKIFQTYGQNSCDSCK